MLNALQSKVLTVRLPFELYSAAQEIARQRDVSLNSLMQESLLAAIRTAEEQTLYNDYTTLGQDTKMCDVEYAIHAQAEVMLSAETD